MINHKNYEIWFLDFAEGNLSERKIELLMEFLAENKELKAEFDDMELIELPIDNAFAFGDKAKLKRPMTADISLTENDKLLIGELEGDLNALEVTQLQERVLEQPNLIKAQKIYEKSKLTPDFSVKYLDKEGLKRKDRKVMPFRLIMQIAAAILLLFAMFFALRKGVDVDAVDMPIVESPTQIVPDQSNQIEQVVKPEIVEHLVDAPKPIVEQPIIPLNRKQSIVPKVRVHQELETTIEIVPNERPIEVIVSQEPASLKNQAPQMKSPPKPLMKPEWPKTKPVLAVVKPISPNPKATFVDQKSSSNKRLIALNNPKDFILETVDKSIKKLVKKENVQEKISVPEAIVSTVGTITNTKTSYKKKRTNDSRQISMSIGRFKFKRIKHRSR